MDSLNIELYFIYVIITIFIIIELFFYLIIRFVNKKFQWLIISKDEEPSLSKDGLKKFIPNGYDSELGWVRKPNTVGTENSRDTETKWTVDPKGCRTNPRFEKFDSAISCYGDSFTFCRQVNDNETWEHYLSKLQNTNVQNFGVGNYGLDQALLRLKREYPKNKTNIVILAVVPDTISRILSSWKHYYEYGNTFAFKPRFILKNNNLELVRNYIDTETKFENYKEFLKEIRITDFFYIQKFKKDILRFPYSITIFKSPLRNFRIIFWVITIELFKKMEKNMKKIEWNPMKIIMKINLLWRVKLYQNKETIMLLEKIINEYISYAKQNNFVPFFVILPQKDDVSFIRNNFHFYKNFVNTIKTINDLHVIDITEKLLLENNLDLLYSDDNDYGGHFSKIGNQLIANIINEKIEKFH